MRFFTLITFLFSTALSWSQEYSYQYETEINPDEIYIFNQDSFVYFLQLKNTKNLFEYTVNLVELNKHNKNEQSITLEKELVSIREGLQIYLWAKTLFFVEIDDYNQLLKITSQSINGDKSKNQTQLIDIRKKEKFLTTYQIDHSLYLLTVSPKEEAINIYAIDLNTSALKTMTIPIHSNAFNLIKGRSNRNIATIDFDTPNSLLKMTRQVKIYQSDNTLTITFDVKENTPFLYNTHIYTIALQDQSFKHRKIPFEQAKWNSFNSTLYKGHLYRIMSQDDLIQVDAIDYQKDSIILKVLDGKDYIRMDFQKSIAVNQLGYPIPKANEAFETLLKYDICIFPEVQNGKTVFYIGGIGKSRGLSKQEIENATPYEVTYNFDYVNTGNQKSYYAKEDLSTILFESTIGLNGKIETVKDLDLEINPNFRVLDNALDEMATEFGGKKISIYKMDNQLFGIFYIEFEKKFIIKSLAKL